MANLRSAHTVIVWVIAKFHQEVFTRIIGIDPVDALYGSFRSFFVRYQLLKLAIGNLWGEELINQEIRSASNVRYASEACFGLITFIHANDQT